MSQAVVDPLQVIEIQQQQCEMAKVALRPAHFTVQLVEKFAIVRQASESVMRRLVTHFLLTPLSISDIQPHPNAADDFSVDSAQRR